MTKHKKLLIGITLIAVTASGLAACGHFRHHDPVEKMEYITEKVDDKLELTDSQRAELDKLKDQLLTLLTDVKTRKETTHKEVDKLMSQPNLDQEKLLALIHEQTNHVNQSAPQLVAAMAGFYDSLTPDQQATLREQFARHREHHGYWH